jgi:hypothetical protein
MRINWKWILIAAILSELVSFAIYAVVWQYAGTTGKIIYSLDWFGLMFWGGLWVSHKIESRFVLHGLLVGLVANILYIPLRPFDPGVAFEANSSAARIIAVFVVIIALKILGAMAGAYVGGRRRKKQLSARAGQLPN